MKKRHYEKKHRIVVLTADEQAKCAETRQICPGCNNYVDPEMEWQEI